MDPVELLQKTLSVFSDVAQGDNSTMATATNATNSPSSTNATPGLSGLLTMLLSFSALTDWLKLFVIGGAVESCRRLLFSLWRSFTQSFWITATFDCDDLSFNWIMFWLSKHPKWGKARTLEVSTRSFGLSSAAVTVDGEGDCDSNRKLSYLPSVSESYSLWHKHRYMTVIREKSQDGFYRTVETLQIKILARDHRVLTDLLLEAKMAYQAAQEHLISVYVSDACNSWRMVATRPKRPLKSIVLDPGLKDLLLEDARDFLASKSWYSERGIPFRRGYLLYGAPGSGKTSIIQSIAGELGLDVYVISLSRMGLDDTGLSELISELPEKCIALMEDIDAAFHRGITRDMDENPNKPKKPQDEREKEKDEDKSSRITLSGLLNALDGVGAQEGRILFATTNRYNALDPALCRPGRMDLHIEFKLASKYQAEELFKCFYMPSDTPIPESSEKVVEKPEQDVDSAYASGSSSPATSEVRDLIDLDCQTHRLRGPKLSASHVSALAASFAAAIPDREVSMASLQGYLMMYKTRPVEAAHEAPAWVDRQREERLQKTNPTPGDTSTS
ncbi:unnamed protein product [Somion occarium]|uniref:P-loop containing nucleoside triphosphate hydrolase protein n=1 Tax=Somion occarium TaxID=3059160 RepID=A0ABP1E2I7_9APHY